MARSYSFQVIEGEPALMEERRGDHVAADRLVEVADGHEVLALARPEPPAVEIGRSQLGVEPQRRVELGDGPVELAPSQLAAALWACVA